MGTELQNTAIEFFNSNSNVISAAADAAAAVLTVLAVAVAAGTLLAAIFAMRTENRREHFFQEIDLLNSLEDRFMSADTQDRALKAANTILESKENPSRKTKEELDHSLVVVLNFFQLIARLWLKGALDTELIWNNFYMRISTYWELSRDLTNDVRSKHPLIWRDIPELLEKLHGVNAELHKPRLKELREKDKKAYKDYLMECCKVTTQDYKARGLDNPENLTGDDLKPKPDALMANLKRYIGGADTDNNVASTELLQTRINQLERQIEKLQGHTNRKEPSIVWLLSGLLNRLRIAR